MKQRLTSETPVHTPPPTDPSNHITDADVNAAAAVSPNTRPERAERTHHGAAGEPASDCIRIAGATSPPVSRVTESAPSHSRRVPDMIPEPLSFPQRPPDPAPPAKASVAHDRDLIRPAPIASSAKRAAASGAPDRFVAPAPSGAPTAASVDPSPLRALPFSACARVLIVDDDPTSLRELEALARESLVTAIACDSSDAAIASAYDKPFHAAILALRSAPRFAEAQFVLARALRAVPGHERLPLAFISADGAFEHRIAAAHAGASLFLSKPIDPYVFTAALQQLLALRSSERTRILLVDDDDAFAETVVEVLNCHGISASRITHPSRVLDAMDDVAPDLVLLDVGLPDASGLDVARMLRTTPRWQDIPILFLTGYADVASRVAAFQAGGDDYLNKPILAEELLARVRVRLDRRRTMREMIEKDALTQVLSRRAVLEGLARRLSEARRHDLALSLSIIDVDAFKQVNDAHGHMVGDQVLSALGRLLNERFRLEDLRGRWGGEEFVIVFPGETADTAAGVLQRVLA